MVHKLKTIRGDMLVLQCQLERELIRYVRRYLCSRRSQSSQTISSLSLCVSCTTMWRTRSSQARNGKLPDENKECIGAVLGRVDDEYRGRRYGGFHQESR